MATIRSADKTALLVVDAQVGVLRNGWDAPRVVHAIARLVSRARAQRVPVLWVQHADEELVRGSVDWRLTAELVPANSEPLIGKAFNSAFEQTSLEDHLSRLGTSHIVLAGAATNWCIRATAYAALERGYDLTLIKDGHTTEPVDAGDGQVVEPRSMINDLNVAMTWLRYPGRRARAVDSGEIVFP